MQVSVFLKFIDVSPVVIDKVAQPFGETCHSADTSSHSVLKHLLKGEAGAAE